MTRADGGEVTANNPHLTKTPDPGPWRFGPGVLHLRARSYQHALPLRPWDNGMICRSKVFPKHTLSYVLAATDPVSHRSRDERPSEHEH